MTERVSDTGATLGMFANPLNHDPLLTNISAFKPYIMTGDAGRFLGFWSCMVNATFAYLGTELVGVTVAEAQNPRKTIPRAIKLTFYRILFFYCLSVLLVGMIVPYDSEKLAFGSMPSLAVPSPICAPE